MMNNPQLELQTLVSKALTELQIPVPAELHFEHPANYAHGEYSSNVAFAILGKKKLEENVDFSYALSTYHSPKELAEKLVQQLQKLQENSFSSLISSVSVAGPGFINFEVSDRYLLQQTAGTLSEEPKTVLDIGKQRPVVVEFSSPNIAKPFTVGHLRSTIIGNAVANIYKAVGYHVFRDNHLGDWGTQFGKQITAIKEWGDESAIDASAEPVKELVQLYVRYHTEAESRPELDETARAWFKKLEEGDVEARRLWQKCIDWSLKEFQRIYKKLGVSFTENNGIGYGESYFEDKMTVVVDELKKKNLLQTSQDAQVVFFPKEEFPPLMILKKDGATLYATRDLATDFFRLGKYGSDVLVINEVGAEQSLYFQQLYKLEEMLGWYQPGQRVHVKHGHFRFNDKKMSTRKGNVIWLSDVLDEAVKRATEFQVKGLEATSSEQDQEKKPISKELAEIIGIGALKWNDLKRSSILEVVFDWDEMLSLQGNSGPYMQYTYARCQSVLQKAKHRGISVNVVSLLDLAVSEKMTSLNQEEKTVFRLLSRFNEVVLQAAKEFAPHLLCTYLFELAQSFNSFYNKHSILGKVDELNSEEILQKRLLLTTATARTIQTGLQLLGIQTVENM